MNEDEGHNKNHKLIFIGLAVFTVLVLVALHLGYGPRWYQGYQPDQPIPFSHAQHAGQYKIPCLYCHSQAEYSAHASVPSLETCMNCHSAVKLDSPWMKMMKEHYDAGEPIVWTKVHVLPDFVRFNHQPHIAAGVECQQCHGSVEEMEKVYQWAPLSMGWCIDCHRNSDLVTEARRELLTKGLEMQADPIPPLNQILGHPPIHNADVSCSTCHY